MVNESKKSRCACPMRQVMWHLGSVGTRTLRHTATHCNTLQHTATHCNTLQHTATHYSTLQHTATHCNTLQHAATHYQTLQHIEPCRIRVSSGWSTATRCNTLQHSATRCNTLQHFATRCNTEVKSCSVRFSCVHMNEVSFVALVGQCARRF